MRRRLRMLIDWPDRVRLLTLAAEARLETLDSEVDALRAVYEAGIERQARKIGRLERALESCARNDGTAPYRYGQQRLRDDRPPGDGSRWMTPREVAEFALNYREDE